MHVCARGSVTATGVVMALAMYVYYNCPFVSATGILGGLKRTWNETYSPKVDVGTCVSNTY